MPDTEHYTLDDPRELEEYLRHELSKEDCNHTFQHTKTFLKDRYKWDDESIIFFLTYAVQEHNCWCDCDILANIRAFASPLADVPDPEALNKVLQKNLTSALESQKRIEVEVFDGGQVLLRDSQTGKCCSCPLYAAPEAIRVLNQLL